MFGSCRPKSAAHTAAAAAEGLRYGYDDPAFSDAIIER
jgi:hypothetical protein